MVFAETPGRLLPEKKPVIIPPGSHSFEVFNLSFVGQNETPDGSYVSLDMDFPSDSICKLSVTAVEMDKATVKTICEPKSKR